MFPLYCTPRTKAKKSAAWYKMPGNKGFSVTGHGAKGNRTLIVAGSDWTAGAQADGEKSTSR
jgi:hypothetical protein